MFLVQIDVFNIEVAPVAPHALVGDEVDVLGPDVLEHAVLDLGPVVAKRALDVRHVVAVGQVAGVARLGLVNLAAGLALYGLSRVLGVHPANVGREVELALRLVRTEVAREVGLLVAGVPLVGL